MMWMMIGVGVWEIAARCKRGRKRKAEVEDLENGIAIGSALKPTGRIA